MESESTRHHFDQTLRKYADWCTFFGVGALGVYFFGYMIYHSLNRADAAGWFTGIIAKHFAATIGTPLCAASALCVVLALRATTGEIKVNAFGVNLEGAGGPLLFWVICFSAMAIALWRLWVLCP